MRGSRHCAEAAAAAALALCCMVCMPKAHAAALYTKSDDVVTLTGANFDRLVQNTHGVALVEFYAPWCGHCKALAPHFKTVASKLKGVVTVGSVDCDQASNRELCARFGIEGFPTIKAFGPDRVRDPDTGKDSKAVSDFNGPRTAKALLESASSLLSAVHITSVGSLDEYSAFALDRPEVPKVLLFTDKRDAPLMYKGISTQLHLGLGFGLVHESVQQVVEANNVMEFPTVVVTTPDGTRHVYDGELKAHLLRDWVAAFSTDPSAKPSNSSDDKASSKTSSKGSSKGSDDEKEVEDPLSAMTNITVDEAIALDQFEDMALLALWVPPLEDSSHKDKCSGNLAAFAAVASEFGGVVKTVLVEVPREELRKVIRYGVSLVENLVGPADSMSPCIPMLLLLPFGRDKQELDDYAIYKGAYQEGA
ncbi:hypothetical protein FOA52_013519 [Chlamydomonas sp. UWO 241]|nr:hypothetical protein FOA52_013519 [Chlamydomonas sp. UWO 241]